MGLNVTAAPFTLCLYQPSNLFPLFLLEVSKPCGRGRVSFHCYFREVTCSTIPSGEQLFECHTLRPQVSYVRGTFKCYKISLLILFSYESVHFHQENILSTQLSDMFLRSIFLFMARCNPVLLDFAF